MKTTLTINVLKLVDVEIKNNDIYVKLKLAENCEFEKAAFIYKNLAASEMIAASILYVPACLDNDTKLALTFATIKELRNIDYLQATTISENDDAENYIKVRDVYIKLLIDQPALILKRKNITIELSMFYMRLTVDNIVIALMNKKNAKIKYRYINEENDIEKPHRPVKSEKKVDVLKEILKSFKIKAKLNDLEIKRIAAKLNYCDEFDYEVKKIRKKVNKDEIYLNDIVDYLPERGEVIEVVLLLLHEQLRDKFLLNDLI